MREQGCHGGGVAIIYFAQFMTHANRNQAWTGR